MRLNYLIENIINSLAKRKLGVFLLLLKIGLFR